MLKPVLIKHRDSKPRLDYKSRQITTLGPQISKSNFIFDVRRVEFIFSQTAPVVCLPCKQTDFLKRIIALFKVLLYRVDSKKLLKIENTRSNQFELEFSFSFDQSILINNFWDNF